MVGAFSYSAKSAKYRLPWLIKGQIQKTSRYILSKQEGNEYAKKPSHATVPLIVICTAPGIL
jgi:hypothetical protein